MDKVLYQVKEELAGLTDNYWKDIMQAASDMDGVTLTYKVNIEPDGQAIKITPSIEFYPMGKVRSEKYTVEVDTKQMALFEASK